MTDRSWSEFIPGIPAPQGSKNHVGGGRMKESSKLLPAWRKAIIAWAQDEHGRPRVQYPQHAPLYVGLEFYMPRPKYLKPGEFKPYTRTPDLDKLVRAVFDALTIAGIWHDDSQAVTLMVRKWYADHDAPTGAYVYIARND